MANKVGGGGLEGGESLDGCGDFSPFPFLSEERCMVVTLPPSRLPANIIHMDP